MSNEQKPPQPILPSVEALDDRRCIHGVYDKEECYMCTPAPPSGEAQGEGRYGWRKTYATMADGIEFILVSRSEAEDMFDAFVEGQEEARAYLQTKHESLLSIAKEEARREADALKKRVDVEFKERERMQAVINVQEENLEFLRTFRSENEALKKRVEQLTEALVEARDEFTRIATLREQVIPPEPSSHASEKKLMKGAEVFARVAATEISRVLSIHREALARKDGEE